MQKTKFDWDSFAISLGLMVVSIIISLLLCTEFHIGWIGGLGIYFLIFNFMRVVDKVVGHE